MPTDPTSVSPWSDDSRGKSDIAGRSEFASAVATRIGSCVDGQSSTVFGVVGPWGSGKTTLLRDIAGQLDGWKIVWFSPWSVADAGLLTSEFVSALGEAFPQSSPVKKNLARSTAQRLDAGRARAALLSAHRLSEVDLVDDAPKPTATAGLPVAGIQF